MTMTLYLVKLENTSSTVFQKIFPNTWFRKSLVSWGIKLEIVACPESMVGKWVKTEEVWRGKCVDLGG